MTIEEIHAVTAEFAEAAKRSITAGFDGVEIHGYFLPLLHLLCLTTNKYTRANGYLLEQFLHDNVNERALEAGSDDEEIAEHTGLDCEQVAAIRLVVCP